MDLQLTNRVELPVELNEAIRESVEATLSEIMDEYRKGNEYPRYMTKQEASSYLGIAYGTLTKLVDNGEIPAKKIGSTFRFDRLKLDDFMATI